jgi:serine/threonine protein kinase
MLNCQGYNEKVDIWSFGVLVYVLVFGSFPYTCREYAAAPMKAAIIKGIPPKFQPVEDRSFFDVMRSSSIVDFSKRLLERDPEERPSAVDAMSSTFMLSVASDTHMCGVNLPSLSSTLQRAKNAFAFEIHDLSRETVVDELLHELQMRKHGRPLCNAPRNQRISEQSCEFKKKGFLEVVQPKGSLCSGRSTTLDNTSSNRSADLSDSSISVFNSPSSSRRPSHDP